MKPNKKSFAGNVSELLIFIATVLALPAGSAIAQQGAGITSVGNLPASTIAPQPNDDRYRIGPGDVLTVTVLDYPQLSSDAIKVDSRGMILLPMIEAELTAACLTENELGREIAKRDLKYLKEPQVRVFVKDYQSQQVAVMGAVKTPGRFQLQRRVRLLELLTFVGGPADQAGQTLQVIHAGSGPRCNGAIAEEQSPDSQLLVLKLSETLHAQDQANPFVESGDIIMVPDADQYYLLGNVAKPSAYPLKDRVSITQAIAYAGGTLPDTKTDRIRIVRQAPGASTRTEILVDLKKVMKAGGEEVLLQPNDIVEVPKQGGATMFFKNTLRSIAPMMTNLPLRVIY
jgi:polysaccharide export outer membrane protein